MWIIIACIVVILVIVWYKCRGEVFMPTATMMYQQNDNVLVASPEHMEPVKKWTNFSWQH